jgi:DMSO/TMAO reductase YedYZ molybdopterin-dependent catalytic subunit
VAWLQSIKWLHRITLTNDYKTNDTYAEQNNDPDSYLKTAAYLDSGPEAFKANEEITIAARPWSAGRA